MKMKEDDIREKLTGLYVSVFGQIPEIEKLPGAGSDRVYYRMTRTDSPTAIGTYGSDTKENECFIRLAGAFREAGIPVPEVFAVSSDRKCYVQEDMGSKDLLSCLKGNERMSLSSNALRHLAGMQFVAPEKWENDVMHSPFSKRMVMWDLNYFKYEFLKPASISFDEEKLEDDFERLCCRLMDDGKPATGFMYRDFQSRNVMVADGNVGFIDFQGGRKGPVVYDVVSFLWQSKAAFTPEEKKILLEEYLAEVRKVAPFINLEELRKCVKVFVLFRTLQVLGAYGFRGLVEKKAHFIESIPGALQNLEELLEEGVLHAYPQLEKVALKCVGSRFSLKGREKEDGLTVRVFSFSYKKGYPEDLSGNGGGFMFDCRGMHNPGRYAEYKTLTGLDEPVKTFLEERGEVQRFVENAIAIVSPTTERYLARGFTGLQVGFGCTGGQHRSVYCAQRFGEAIKRLYPSAKVIIQHREQGITRIED